MSEQALARTPVQMWQDYLFLTREMIRFLKDEEMDLFNELLNQREQLQKLLGAINNVDFHRSLEGRQLLAEIRQINQQITFQLRYYLNKANKQQKIDNAYEGVNYQTMSSRVEWKL